MDDLYTQSKIEQIYAGKVLTPNVAVYKGLRDRVMVAGHVSRNCVITVRICGNKTNGTL